jgi:hypothetical protein
MNADPTEPLETEKRRRAAAGDLENRGVQRRRLRIAITLLVLDIRLGYVTSFLTIGGIWLAHHVRPAGDLPSRSGSRPVGFAFA